ncbi:MAG: GNAT family N-acetyltransferase [Ignavibacteria bacterium]|nr:GNAT family N-acetyltransferase [Ignavibacteria bacterium]
MNDIKIVNKSLELADSFRDALDSVSRERMWLAFTEAPPYEHMRKFVQGLISDNDIQVYAVLGDTVVGWCDITRRKRSVFAHTGSLGMGIVKEYRGKGLGSRMMEEVIKQARTNGLEKICLEVYSHNAAGIALYKKFGFVEEGKKIREAKLDGKYLDEYFMGLQLL